MVMRHEIAEALLLVGGLLLAIGSVMLVSTSHATDPDYGGTVSCYDSLEKRSGNAQATYLEDNKNRACITSN
jgi:hypothetical protein